MINLSQNKKIAITTIVLFLISFSIMLFFLENSGKNIENGKVNVLDIEGEKEQKDESEHYKSLLDDKEAPFFVTNAEGKIKYSSEEFCKMLSVKCEKLAGGSIFDYINSKDLPAVISDHTKLIQGGDLKEGLGPYRMVKRNAEILVLLNAYPILDKKDKVSEIVFSVKDITDQIKNLNKETEEDDKNWLEELYPKIKELKNNQEMRMMVDKTS